jgi:hypothetical protein
MDKEKPVTPGFTDTISITDGILLEHRRGGKLINHRLVSSKQEINLLTKEVRIKKEE